jgi:aerobic carbon-monoxide dehydrogenase large subunit
VGVARLGVSHPKSDDHALLTGAARFTSDIAIPGMLHGHIVRSPFAHARIVAFDPRPARAQPGVVDVIGPDDVRGLPRFSLAHVKDQAVLALDKVRFVGEPVAAVFAESIEVARAAAELVEVAYEELPLVLSGEAALASDAPLLHEGVDGVEGNVCWRQATRAGDIEAAFGEADLVVRERFETSKAHAMPMETHAALASWDPAAGVLTMWASTQQAHILRDELASVLGLPRNRVRVVKPFVGGAFGHKEGLHPHEALAALAARRTRRSARIVLTRHEEFTATWSRNVQVRDAELALRSDGTILGWRERIVQDCGAYASISPSVLSLSEWVTIGPYRTPAIEIDGVVVYTNKPPSGAFRGFGNPQATFARESLFDIAARRLDIDPADFRRRNLIGPDDLPGRTVTGLRLETLPIAECADLTERAVDYARLRADKPAFRGVGVVHMLEWGGGCRWHPGYDADESSVTIAVEPDGSVTLRTDAADSGQGHATLFTQIVGEHLGVPADRVRVVLADTDATPWGLGTFGSRTAVIAGSAAVRASREIQARMSAVAAQMLEAAATDLEFADGLVRVVGTDRGVPFEEVAGVIHYDRAALPAGLEPSALVATASYDSPSEVPDADGRGSFAANYTCSSTIAVVDVDPETGKVTIVDWTSAEDVGRALNPDIVTTQIQGGIAQGIGFALGEELVLDERGGVINGSMTEYQVPTCPGIPLIEEKLFHVESADPAHPLGQKGIGECGITPPAAAIACAVYDAIGVPITSLPITPEKVQRAIRSSQRRVA